MAANMPNGNARRKFGQGLPPVSVTLKKNERKWQRLEIEIQKDRQRTSISQRLFTQLPHPTPLHKHETALVNIAVLCGSALSHPQKVISQKMTKNGKNTNFGPKNRYFGQQKVF